MLKLYNTASRTKEDFEPLEEGKVKIYACGVTVYDHSHIGHARGAVVFDALVRYLEWLDYEVTYVRNFTDVDDKIINRANEQGVAWNEISEKYIAAYKEDLGRLKLREPDVEPKATEHMAEIVAAVQGLVDKGYAYESQGDVYFSVPSFAPYGSLSKRKLDDQRAGARVEVDDRKRHPLDFALWKASKPGEPSWDSPWGPGRPGWHIECSAMSSKYLGATFDIHGGGEDLVFPHHENEKAQSEALTGKPFAKYWVHNGFVRLDSEKMSKSLGNFLTVHDILEQVDPEALRLFLLSAHYRSPLDYTKEAVQEADKAVRRLHEAAVAADEAAVNPKVNALEGPLAEEAELTADLFESDMADDLNTGAALGRLFVLARSMNRAAYQNKPKAMAGIGEARETLLELAGVLGLLRSDMNRTRLVWADGATIDQAEAERLIADWQKFSSEKAWAKAIALEAEAARAGLAVTYYLDGSSVWRPAAPAETPEMDPARIGELINDWTVASDISDQAGMIEAAADLLRLGAAVRRLADGKLYWRFDPQARQIQALIDQRAEARKNKDFAAADAVRDKLTEQGVDIFDSPHGTTWRLGS